MEQKVNNNLTEIEQQIEHTWSKHAAKKYEHTWNNNETNSRRNELKKTRLNGGAVQ